MTPLRIPDVVFSAIVLGGIAVRIGNRRRRIARIHRALERVVEARVAAMFLFLRRRLMHLRRVGMIHIETLCKCVAYGLHRN